MYLTVPHSVVTRPSLGNIMKLYGLAVVIAALACSCIVNACLLRASPDKATPVALFLYK